MATEVASIPQDYTTGKRSFFEVRHGRDYGVIAECLYCAEKDIPRKAPNQGDVCGKEECQLKRNKASISRRRAALKKKKEGGPLDK